MRCVIVLLTVGVSVLVGGDAFAQRAIQYEEGTLDSIVNNFVNPTFSWEATLQAYARNLLFLLAGIGLCWQGIQVALKRSDWNDVIREVIMIVMTVGFYLFLIENMHWITTVLLESFEQIAVDILPAGSDNPLTRPGDDGLHLSPSSVMAMGYSIYGTLVDAGTWFEPGRLAMLALIGVVVVILFGGIAAYLMLVLVEGFVVSTAGIIFLGFAGIEFTIDVAKNYLRYLLSFAVKLFAVYIILAVGLTVLDANVMSVFRVLETTKATGIAREILMDYAMFWGVATPLVMLILSFMVPAVFQQIAGGMGSHGNFALNSVLTTTLMTAASVGQKAAGAAGVAGMGGGIIGKGMHNAGKAAMGGLGGNASMGDKMSAYTSGASGAFKGAMGSGLHQAMDQGVKDFSTNHGHFMEGATHAMFPDWKKTASGGGEAGGK